MIEQFTQQLLDHAEELNAIKNAYLNERDRFQKEIEKLKEKTKTEDLKKLNEISVNLDRCESYISNTIEKIFKKDRQNCSWFSPLPKFEENDFSNIFISINDLSRIIENFFNNYLKHYPCFWEEEKKRKFETLKIRIETLKANEAKKILNDFSKNFRNLREFNQKHKEYLNYYLEIIKKTELLIDEIKIIYQEI
jgi:hypothetical protein